MEFHQEDTKRFIADSIPSRFQNLSPAAFTGVMADVFRADGYTVEEISKADGNAGDLIARKEGVSLVIKALRYPAEHKAGLQEIQQAAAARTYFETDQSWIITTSSFTDQARKSAEALDIELWDWDELNEAIISTSFFERKKGPFMPFYRKNKSPLNPPIFPIHQPKPTQNPSRGFKKSLKNWARAPLEGEKGGKSPGFSTKKSVWV